MSSGYKIIEHTADFGIRVWAKQLPEVFREAAMATMASIVDPETVEIKDSVPLHVEDTHPANLLHRMIRELLYVMQQNEMVFTEFQIENHNLLLDDVDTYFMDAKIDGERLDPARHGICKEIKALTYHDYYLKKNGPWWEVSLLFDV